MAICCFSFDWNCKEPIPNDETKTVKIIASSSGKAQALLMWWTLDMDREGEIVLSCAPPWAHPEGNLCNIFKKEGAENLNIRC